MVTRSVRRLTGTLVLTLCPALLGACSEGPSSPDAATSATERAAGSTPAAQAAEPAAMALMAEGLSLLPVGVFQPQVIAFGTRQQEVEAAAASAFPGEQPKRSENGECGAGPMQFTRYGTLSLAFQDGAFAGWTIEDPAPLATIDGIQTGITLADLKRERPVEVPEDSTLEGEFNYTLPNETVIGGFAEGEGDSARITMLFSGTTCFFR